MPFLTHSIRAYLKRLIFTAYYFLLTFVRGSSKRIEDDRDLYKALFPLRIINSTSSSKTMRVSTIPLDATTLYNGCRIGADTHADTTCVGKHAYIISQVMGKSIEAVPFSPSLGTVKNLPVVHAAIAFDDPDSGNTTILLIHNAIFIPDMDNILLCPDQARENGITVDLTPTKYDASATFGLTWSDGFHIPFFSNGPVPSVNVRRPTEAEMRQYKIHRHLTSTHDWDPYRDQPSDGAEVYSTSLSIYQALSEHPLDRLLMQQDQFSSTSHLQYDISPMSTNRVKATDPERISALFGCGLKTAVRTLEATTQSHIREHSQSVTKRWRTRRSQLRYRQLSSPYGDFNADVHYAKVKSLRGFTMGNIFCNKLGYIHWTGMNSESQSSLALQLFVQDIGIPSKMHTDNASYYTGGDFQKVIRRENIKFTTIEPYRHNENRAEISIRELKKRVRRIMQRRNIPVRLWCYVTEHVAWIMNLTASDLFRLGGRTPYEWMHGHTPDISEYIEFDMYEPVWFFANEEPFPNDTKQLGRWLGVAHKVGQAMNYYIMKQNGEVIVRSTVSSVEADDIDTISFKERLSLLDEGIASKIGDHRNAIIDRDEREADPADVYLWNINDLDEDFDDESGHDDVDPDDKVKELDDVISEGDLEMLDKFIGTHIHLPVGDEKVLTSIVGKKRDENNAPVGKYNSNPILNTQVYQALMPDGTYNEVSANTIIENIYNEIDSQGHNIQSLRDIIDHKKDASAVRHEDGFVVSDSGNIHHVITTKGWYINVRWSDQSTSWVTLASLKESHPVELADYAYAKGLDKEPAFAWWVSYVRRKRSNLIHKIKSRAKRSNLKFGVVVPKTAEEALELDRVNGNHLWAEAIAKEKTNCKIAFKFLGRDAPPPVGYKRITCHMVFDVKFDLTRKARYVAGGHLTDEPSTMSYASVVSRDSVRILFTIAALNNLDVKMCDIGNAYLNATTREKVYFTAGSEWSDQQGETVIIVRALYGLKTSGAEWKRHFADTLEHTLQFKASRADDNVWMKKCKKADGTEYYSYILVYVDDVLCISENPDYYMDILRNEYRLKGDPEEPNMYLGSDAKKFTITDESGVPIRQAWSLGSHSHVKKAVQVVHEILVKNDLKFYKPKKVPQHPFSSQSYRPELDCSELCNDSEWEIFMSLVGVARWICEIGRVDILTEISLLSTYCAAPRIGHLHQLLHVFHYLEHHMKSTLVMDPDYANIDISTDQEKDSPEHRAKLMLELYPDAVEDIPPDMPEALGNPVEINTFVDSDHAGDSVTRRSRTGIIIFLNKAPILWLSQRQATVESSTFGSEFVAMRRAIEMVKSLRYKLRMFGIPLIGPALVFGDNESVVKNASIPESTLKKKHHSISYHISREAVAAGIVHIIKVASGFNLADIFTKLLPPEQRKFILTKITY